MNLLNYVDRYSFFAVGTHIQNDLKISNQGYGVLSASFMIVYTLVTPLMGWLGDRYNRRVLLASGVGLWSLATVGTAFSHSFAEMFFWRALLGLGEATYGVDRPGAAGRPVQPEGPGPGDRPVLPRAAAGRGARVRGRRLGGRRLALAGGVLGRRPARACSRRSPAC